MGFQVNTERKFTVKHSHKVERVQTKVDPMEVKVDGEKSIAKAVEEEIFELEVTFTHLAGEDIDYDELRGKLNNITDVKVLNEETGEEIDNNSYNAFLYTLRKGLIDCKGFTDQNGKDLVITQKNGKVNGNIQITIFEAVRTIPEFFEKVVTAYTGIDSKN